MKTALFVISFFGGEWGGGGGGLECLFVFSAKPVEMSTSIILAYVYSEDIERKALTFPAKSFRVAEFKISI